MGGDRIPLPLASDACTSCGMPAGEPHDEDCLFAEHEAALGGDELARAIHAEDCCYWCLAEKPPVLSSCRCGQCCRLLIEVTLDDARREPRIAAEGSPTYTPAALTASGQPELEGYLLNSAANGNACAFLDQRTNLCTIHETRPLLCRLFDCDGEGREQLIELGSLNRDDRP